MRRGWLVLMLLAGCDRVYGLEGRLPPEARPGDHDGDGKLDNVDSCPHIENESSTDGDGDGISIDCDADDDDASTMFRWFALTAGSIEGLTHEGFGKVVEDGFELGDHDAFSTLVFDVDTGTTMIDVGFEIVSNAVEDEEPYDWSELGIFSVHRSFRPDDKERGDVCFLGVSQDTSMDPPVFEDAYLEMNEDEVDKPVVEFDRPLTGSRGRFRQQRAPNRVSCSVVRPGLATVNATFPVNQLATTTGKIAFSSHFMVAKLTYLWIAWQPI